MLLGTSLNSLMVRSIVIGLTLQLQVNYWERTVVDIDRSLIFTQSGIVRQQANRVFVFLNTGNYTRKVRITSLHLRG